MVSLFLVSSSKTLYSCLLFHIRATCPVHLIPLNLMTGIVSGEEYRSRSFSLCSFLQSPIVSALFYPNMFLSTPFSNSLSPSYCLYMTDHVLYSSQITGKIIFPCILIVICLGIKRKGKRFIHNATLYYEGSQICRLNMRADRWKGIHTKFCSSTLPENGNLKDRHEDRTRFTRAVHKETELF